MELPYVTYKKSDFIETDTGNKISRQSLISGSQNIVLGGKTIVHPHCTIRGDLRRSGPTHQASVLIGRFCSLGSYSVLRPPYKTYKGVFSYYPLKVGDFVDIGEGSIVEAASVGSWVKIGRGCVVGRFAFIKEGCVLEDGAVVPPGMVVPPFSVVTKHGVMAMPESVQDVLELAAKDRYAKFVPL
ncbi:hypothetical protein H4R27_005113 [Coemansia aciculifera]|uniref:Dynactin subunit 5 n=1 Tax=Coemansia pectinata TaxID=1052879 RepID=A0A9W8LA16_9FUNG|nr:hypothetical protein GGI17_006318 [Coemansia sp. S146]KAJ2752586.1 hypothetical protein GGI19_003734 [Coemansia pectinata]KAJ2879770.1 hypothetical protein H4R27_005113 [Coemansia aciculifera]